MPAIAVLCALAWRNPATRHDPAAPGTPQRRYPHPRRTLNGGSSSGRSTLARALQLVLDEPWLSFGVDSLIEAMPPEATGLDFADDRAIAVGDAFRELERAWIHGIVAMARAGARIIVDDAFLGGAASQQEDRTRRSALIMDSSHSESACHEIDP